MIGWFLFYVLSFLLLLTSRKQISTLYPILFFIFVGFRDNIGTDYTTTAEVIERSYMPLSDFLLNFEGYRFFDLEFSHKIIAMVMGTFNLPMKYYFVILSGIEAIIIHFMLRYSNNTKVILLYFVCLFSINYPMNTMRQGLCFIFILLAFFLEKKNKRFGTYVSYCLALVSHYGSSIIVFFNFFKIKSFKTYIIIGLMLLLIIQFIDLDLLDKRYSSAEGKYGLSGMGLRLYLFAGYYIYSSKKLLGQSFKSQETITLMMILVMIFFKDPFVRLFNFYVYLLCFKNVISLDGEKIIGEKLRISIFFPLIALFLEFFEILRTPYISTAGAWFPYSNWLF